MSYEQLTASVDALIQANNSLTATVQSVQEGAASARDAAESYANASQSSASESAASAALAKGAAEAEVSEAMSTLAGPSGSSQIGTSIGGSGAVTRQLKDRIYEYRSVKDKGATGLGVVDETAAFLASGRGSFVPAGRYVVDTYALDLSQYYGPGELLTKGGQVIRLDNSPHLTEYRQRRVMAPRFGFAPGSGNPSTEIYPGSQYAPQGLAYYRDPDTGEEWMFINQAVAGTTWGPTEYVRIVRTKLREDGLSQEVTDFTPPLRSSHAHLSALKENNKLWLYSSAVAPVGSSGAGNDVGKGWSKIEWKGTANVSEDIQNFYVWGAPGSGHRYANYGKGCVQVSQDGKYMILIGINYSGTAGGRTLFIYDRRQVESMANPLDAEPVYMSRPLLAFPNDADTAYQGETCDGRFVYIIWGSGAAFSRKGVSIYTLTGEKLRDIFFEGPAAEYTNDEIRNGHPTLGTLMGFEPEGITLRGDEIFVTFVDYWRNVTDVVTWDGANYVNLGSANLNNQPDIDTLNWRITDRPATRGTWDSGTTYTLGLMTKRDKVIYCLTPPKGNPLEKPVMSKFVYPGSVAQYPGNVSELINASFDFGGNYRVSAHIPSTDKYRVGYEYVSSYEFNIRDIRTGSDNALKSIFRTNGIIGAENSTLISGNSGGALTLYHPSSSVTPGGVRIAASDSEIRMMVGGATKHVINTTENVDYQPRRPLNDLTDDLGTATRRYNTVRANKYTFNVSTCTDESGVGSPEGVITAGPGSTYRNRSGGANTSRYLKETGTGNTGWVAK